MGCTWVKLSPEVEKGTPSFKGEERNKFLYQVENKYPKRDQISPKGVMRKGFTGTNDTGENTSGVLTQKLGDVP